MFLFLVHRMVINIDFFFAEIYFLYQEKNAKSILQIFKQIEQDIKGRGLLVYVNCEYEIRQRKFILFVFLFLEKEKNFAKNSNLIPIMLNYYFFSSSSVF